MNAVVRVVRGFFTDYKTSILGIAAGAIMALQHGATARQAAAGVAVAILGLLAKDAA